MKRQNKFFVGAAILLIAFPVVRFGPHILFNRRVIEPTQAYQRAGNASKRKIKFTQADFYFYPSTVDAEEVRFNVPQSRAHPTGRQLQLHYIRFPTTSSHPAAPIVYLAGGPGGSGTRTASDDRFKLFMKLRAVADVIAFDQRGTSYTSPIPECPGSWSYPLDKPMDSSILRKSLAPYLEQCAESLGGVFDLKSFNTIESADDLDDLRRVLGARQLNLWGISYGTHLALAYIKRHGQNVERAVLAGTEGPDDTYKLPSRIELIVSRVDSALRRDSRASEVVPGFRDGIGTILKRLESNPTVHVTDKKSGNSYSVTLGKLDLQRALFFSLNEHDGIEKLLVRLVPMMKGDLSELGVFALRTRRKQKADPMAMSMDCASGASPERLAAIARETPHALFADVANLDIKAKCASWPHEDLGSDYWAQVSSQVPVLFISGTFDARTPPENALAASAGFPNAKHFLIEGGGHDDDLLIANSTIEDAIRDYFRSGQVPVNHTALRPYRFKLP